MDGEFAQTQAGRPEEGGEVTVHAFKGDEEAGVFPAHDFEGATGIVGPIHEDGATNEVSQLGGDFFGEGIHAGGTDATGEVGLPVE